MINATNVYNSSLFTKSGDNFLFNHNAYGADKFRYSWNFGVNWTEWKDWEDQTTIAKSQFVGDDYFWDGHHIMVQCKFNVSKLVAESNLKPHRLEQRCSVGIRGCPR
jgi:hypothetical protein